MCAIYVCVCVCVCVHTCISKLGILPLDVVVEVYNSIVKADSCLVLPRTRDGSLNSQMP